MRKLTNHEKLTLVNILDDLMNCEMYTGKYDAKFGNQEFMFGIENVLETLFGLVNNELAYEFSKIFFENMVASEEMERLVD